MIDVTKHDEHLQLHAAALDAYFDAYFDAAGRHVSDFAEPWHFESSLWEFDPAVYQRLSPWRRAWKRVADFFRSVAW